MSTQKKELTQNEMSEAINLFLTKSYITYGKIKATPLNILESLNINVSEDILGDVKMSMRCMGIEGEIQFQCEIENSKEFTNYYDKVSKKIKSFDFSKYENMSIEELQSYLYVWNENVSGCLVTGDNLIKNKIDRACVAIYSKLKGGTYIYEDKDSEEYKNLILNSEVNHLIKKLNDGHEISQENKTKILEALN